MVDFRRVRRIDEDYIELFGFLFKPLECCRRFAVDDCRIAIRAGRAKVTHVSGDHRTSSSRPFDESHLARASAERFYANRSRACADVEKPAALDPRCED